MNNSMATLAQSSNTHALMAAAGLGSGSTAGMVWSILFGIIGSVYFFYGKRQQRFSILLAGVALCIYTFVISNTYAIIGVGMLLTVVPYFLNF